ncbi:MAG TPA: hypothetical protein VHM19_06210, partial [Polyangiales bacterium]|jgi:hypothetical protein|nr:hypothetical protein [Polyangiales bacterium]
MGHPYPAFDAYLSSPDSQSALPWQLASLAALRFVDIEPTVELYRDLRSALDTATKPLPGSPGLATASPRDHAVAPRVSTGERR